MLQTVYGLLFKMRVCVWSFVTQVYMHRQNAMFIHREIEFYYAFFRALCPPPFFVPPLYKYIVIYLLIRVLLGLLLVLVNLEIH